jgi:hypothetical protein
VNMHRKALTSLTLLGGGLACVALLLAGVALADIAPPLQPPGSNIDPSGQTQVRMSAERVVLDVQPYKNIAIAKVTGDFTMRNTGTSEEKMQVRFPLGDTSGFGSGYGDYPEVVGFAVNKGAENLPITVVTTTNPQDAEHPIRWAAFDVIFPAGKDVPIQVTYSITSTGYPPEAQFAYVLETGAGWKDTIGSADVVLRLPYEATDENVLTKESITPGGKFSGNEIRWHWDNLEPTPKDNVHMTILSPKAWQGILDARAAVQAKPNDADALAALARAYDAAVTSRFALDEQDRYALLSEQIYDKAIAARPDSAALHAEYAKAIWDHMMVESSPSEDDPNLLRVLTQISLALSLDPNNQQAKDLLKDVEDIMGGPVVLPTVTVPAVAQVTSVPPTQAATAAAPIETSAPVALPTPAATTEQAQVTPTVAGPITPSGGNLPLVLAVIGAVIVVAAFALVALRARRV